MIIKPLPIHKMKKGKTLTLSEIEALGLQPQQVAIMQVVRRYGICTPLLIQVILGMDNKVVSNRLLELENKGLLTRPKKALIIDQAFYELNPFLKQYLESYVGIFIPKIKSTKWLESIQR